jgi:hypothetical protein
MMAMTEEERRERRRAYRRIYDQSPKGRAAKKRYQQSPEGKATRKRYEQSPEGKAAKMRYEQSPKGKAVLRRVALASEAREQALSSPAQADASMLPAPPAPYSRRAAAPSELTARNAGVALVANQGRCRGPGQDRPTRCRLPEAGGKRI